MHFIKRRLRGARAIRHCAATDRIEHDRNIAPLRRAACLEHRSHPRFVLAVECITA